MIDSTEAGSGKLTLCVHVCVTEKQSCRDTSMKFSACSRLEVQSSSVSNYSTIRYNKGKGTLCLKGMNHHVAPYNFLKCSVLF